MKKATALLLAFLMVLSLTASGDQPNGDSNATNGQTESATLDSGETGTSEEITQPQETTEPEETEAPTEPEEDAPAFDTSWASNEFESQLAEPEFENWKVSSHIEGQSWEIFVQAVHYNTVKAYAADLRSYGFADNESENDGFNGLAYIFEADNENGYHAKIIFEAGDRDGNGSFTLKISK